jgi:hypothetical protein
MTQGLTVSQKVRNYHFSSFRRKPEPSVLKHLCNPWTPFFNGVTTFYEPITFNFNHIVKGGEMMGTRKSYQGKGWFCGKGLTLLGCLLVT